MRKTEIVKLFAVIRSNYQSFETTNEKLETWGMLMADLPFGTALANLMEFMKHSKYPPVASDIFQRDVANVGGNYEQLRIATAERFAEMEQWEQQALPECPEHLLPKLLGSGKEVDKDE